MIIDKIIDYAVEILQEALIDGIPTDDLARAGVVMAGPLQGTPDPDAAVISVTLHENDPDVFYGGVGSSSVPWTDEVYEIECGGTVTWRRRFTVKARCLFVNTGYDLPTSRQITSTLRSRIETALLRASWRSLIDDETEEYVSRGVFSESIKGEQLQSGGPPDAYDFHIKIRFELLTTRSTT